MNERNVDALYRILDPHDEDGAARYNAELLAEAGVLVPSAMTPAESTRLVGLSNFTDELIREEAVAILERIAKGDPA